MRNKTAYALLFLFFAASFAFSQGIRKPVWAGQFYDDDGARLSSQLDAFLQNVKTKPSISKDIQALICPHAGYVYSGQVAAYAYSLVQGKKYDTVIVIGPSHHYGFEGCSIYSRGGFETPLGVAQVDEALASKLSDASGFGYIPQAHQKEHSVEVQIPFIQKVLPEAKIVPIVMGYPQEKTINALANALAKVLPQKNILVVISTDMSHFLAKEEANKVDADTISLVQNLKINKLVSKLEANENILCGGAPVAAMLLSLQKKGTPKVEILKYADSSDAGTSESQVVGYFAAAVYLESAPDPKPQDTPFTLSSEEKKDLLAIARSAINLAVKENKVYEYETQNPNFIKEKGAFVTIKKRGNLRGCIGFIEPIMPLSQAIIRAAIYAALEDPRFPAVSEEELKDLELEISVLTPPEKIKDPSIVKVGKHGLIISKGDRKGVLLPQVPVENNWDREEFLREVCLKAGLPEDAWKSGADLFVFEAIVFH
jgi:hypothetical protein